MVHPTHFAFLLPLAASFAAGLPTGNLATPAATLASPEGTEGTSGWVHHNQVYRGPAGKDLVCKKGQFLSTGNDGIKRCMGTGALLPVDRINKSGSGAKSNNCPPGAYLATMDDGTKKCKGSRGSRPVHSGGKSGPADSSSSATAATDVVCGKGQFPMTKDDGTKECMYTGLLK